MLKLKRKLSIPVQISLKVTLAISAFLILLFVLFTWALRWSATKEKSQQLKISSAAIAEHIKGKGKDELSLDLIDIPYYVSYSVYEGESEKSLEANNILPRLSRTKGRVLHYTEKNFYIDGNLDVLYMTQTVQGREGGYFLQTAIDVETDSASKLIYSMPKIIPLVMIPVSLLTFLILLLFINKDFEREHNFSANVSHELQTPVNAILGHANLLSRWGKEDEKTLEASLAIIKKEANSMKATITNLLQISKLEKGMISIHKGPVDIQEFFESIKKEFAYEKELEITAELKTGIVVPTDEELLHQLFVIAISNSMKFCPRPCRIELKAEHRKNKTILEIKDNGEGFSKEIIPHVFERFYRGDESHTRSKGGAGLGLSIAKSIADSLGAKISAGNAEKNAGGAVIRLELAKEE